VRDPGFPTLVHIILEQQVSLASAKGGLRPFECRRPPAPSRPLPEAHRRGVAAHRLQPPEDSITRACSPNRWRAAISICESCTTCKTMPPARCWWYQRHRKWTADIYLLSALRRPDIWPTGDLALATAVQEVKRLRRRPSRGEARKNERTLESRGAPSPPRLFWHHYLSKRGQRTSEISL